MVAQRRDRVADREVELGIEIGAERHLHDRDIGVRVHEQHRHEHAVIEPTVRVEPTRDPRGGEQFGDPACQLRRAVRRVSQLVGVGREPVVVEQQRRGR